MFTHIIKSKFVLVYFNHAMIGLQHLPQTYSHITTCRLSFLAYIVFCIHQNVAKKQILWPSIPVIYGKPFHPGKKEKRLFHINVRIKWALHGKMHRVLPVTRYVADIKSNLNWFRNLQKYDDWYNAPTVKWNVLFVFRTCVLIGA